ncbi:hypothetical protein CFC21_094335 [Triticum aestivum]|uniref:Serine-rich protein n=3 Tax=Triticinae TaxID=1648030 RepID=A0A453PY32_AEGTS|nr:uncharacterized protein LOC109755529 [Aegilops tauschii subsp. strangulata]XP_044417017.1 uncharacterized protein LOC123142057 [Triticum aestivum]KAF7091779.1 hypothetical protein CFC21_094335 [Triticum aestivum]
MSTAAASRPSGPILLTPFPNYQSASLSRVKLPAGGASRSPTKSVSVSSPRSSPAGGAATAKIRRTCMCSPTNHPGSFRCSLHKERKQEVPAAGSCRKPSSPPSPPSKRTDSPFAQLGPISSGCTKGAGRTLPQLAPMGSGHWARRALAPSPTAQQVQYRKRASRFHAGPSRLSAASMAGHRAGGSIQ